MMKWLVLIFALPNIFDIYGTSICPLLLMKRLLFALVWLITSEYLVSFYSCPICNETTRLNIYFASDGYIYTFTPFRLCHSSNDLIDFKWQVDSCVYSFLSLHRSKISLKIGLVNGEWIFTFYFFFYIFHQRLLLWFILWISAG